MPTMRVVCFILFTIVRRIKYARKNQYLNVANTIFMRQLKKATKSKCPKCRQRNTGWLDLRENSLDGWLKMVGLGSYEEEKKSSRKGHDRILLQWRVCQSLRTSRWRVLCTSGGQRNWWWIAALKADAGNLKWLLDDQSPLLRSTTLNKSIAVSETESSNLFFLRDWF
jgi:hypothetical protein